MGSFLRAVFLVLLLAAGGVLTYTAQRYEAQNPMASVRLLTPRQWSLAPVSAEMKTMRSPAFTRGEIPLEGFITVKGEIPLNVEISLDSAIRSSDSLMRAFWNIPTVPVDTLRWRLWNECCGFDLRYPVRLQSVALLQAIAHQGGKEWAVVVPEDHL
ncbi:MAG: hypothetical protein ACKOX5_02635, partial [Bacteroidota bacterium]